MASKPPTPEQSAEFEIRKQEFQSAMATNHTELLALGVNNIIQQLTIVPHNMSMFEWKERTLTIEDSTLEILLTSNTPISVDNTYVEFVLNIGYLENAKSANIRDDLKPLNKGMEMASNTPDRCKDRQAMEFGSAQRDDSTVFKAWMQKHLGYKGAGFGKEFSDASKLEGPSNCGAALVKSFAQNYMRFSLSDLTDEFYTFDPTGMINTIALFLRSSSLCYWIIPSPPEQDVTFPTAVMLRQLLGSKWNGYPSNVLANDDQSTPFAFRYKSQECYWTKRTYVNQNKYPMIESSEIKVKIPFLSFFASDNVITAGWTNYGYIRTVITLCKAKEMMWRCITREPKYVKQYQYGSARCLGKTTTPKNIHVLLNPHCKLVYMVQKSEHSELGNRLNMMFEYFGGLSMVVPSRRTMINKPREPFSMTSGRIDPTFIQPSQFSRCAILMLLRIKPEGETDLPVDTDTEPYKFYFGDCYNKRFQHFYGTMKWTITVHSASYTESIGYRMVMPDNKKDGTRYHRQFFLAMNHLAVHPRIWNKQFPCVILDPTDYDRTNLVVFHGTNDATPTLDVNAWTACTPSEDIPLGYEYYEVRDTVQFYKEHLMIVVPQEIIMKVHMDGTSSSESILAALKTDAFVHSTIGFNNTVSHFLKNMSSQVVGG